MTDVENQMTNQFRRTKDKASSTTEPANHATLIRHLIFDIRHFHRHV